MNYSGTADFTMGQNILSWQITDNFFFFVIYLLKIGSEEII